MRALIIGVGGVGGWLTRGLVPMIDAHDRGSMILLVDGDVFEEKNKDRQDFGEFGYKAVVRANELQPRYPDTFIIGQPFWVVEHTEEWPEDGGGMVGVNHLLED